MNHMQKEKMLQALIYLCDDKKLEMTNLLQEKRKRQTLQNNCRQYKRSRI